MPSKIEWTEETWNPVTGCSKISPGCDHCYAERMSKRLAGRCGYPEAPNSFDVALHHNKLGQPLNWRKPRQIFVCSMGDLFHRDVPFEYIAAIFGVMAATPRHAYQILTKRPGRMLKWFGWIDSAGRLTDGCLRADLADYTICAKGPMRADILMAGAPFGSSEWPLPNVWLGVTAEDQKRWDRRVSILRQIPAAVRFVSVEPSLGPIMANLDGISWLICGGEAGPGSRPMHPDWARSLRDQCVEAGVPFFFKSWGDWGMRGPGPHGDDHGVRVRLGRDGRHSSSDRPAFGVPGNGNGDGDVWLGRFGKKSAGRELDGRTWDEMPEVV